MSDSDVRTLAIRRRMVSSEKWSGVGRLARLILISVIPGILVGFCTIAFVYQLVFAYYVLSPDDVENIKTATALVGGAIPEVLFALLVLTSGCAAGHYRNSRAWLPGLLCGVTAAATEQIIIALNYPPVLALELAAYFIIGICFGALGGWLGGKEATRSAASERALYSAMREIGSANDSGTVARAIGSLFGSAKPVGVALWLDVPEGTGMSEPTAVWQNDKLRPFSPERLLGTANDMALPVAGVRSVRALKPQRDVRDKWRQQSLESALVSPLLFSGRESSGLLFVGFAEAGRASRVVAAWRTKRRLLTATAGAALALEKENSGRMLGVLQERQRVSREIHDTLLQYFITIGGELATAELAATSDADSMVDTHLRRARDGVRRGTEEARRLMREMRPEVLDGSSLPEALTILTRRISEESRLRVTCEVLGAVRPLAPEVEHALTRITEEALANVRKHSGASRAHASLEFRPAGVTLVVSDDGVGLGDPSDVVRRKRGSFGIRSMMERAGSIDGQLRVESPDDKGTVVVVDVVTDGGGV